MAKRTRYQYGSVEIDKRVTGPDVWIYRWRETTSDGRKKRRGFTVGTVEQYRTEAHALKAAEGMRVLINDGVAAREPVLFCGVLDGFLIEQTQEQETEQVTHGTLASYRSMISQHILPKWGDMYLQDVRPALVQDWLRKLTLSPTYKGHMVEPKGISKRRKRPRILQVKNAWRILDALAQPYRTIVLIALCFALRISEILGLRWTDFDFKRSAVLIQRSAVGKRLNKLKTECSQDEVPLERGFILELKKWQGLCLESGTMAFPQSGDWPTLVRRLDSCRLFGTDGFAIGTWEDPVPHVPPHLPCVAGRNRSSRGCAAETHATRAYFHHDGPVWQCVNGSQAQSQSVSGAEALEKNRWQRAGFPSIK